MRIFYLMIGFTSLGLALLGVVLPLLPTTPFLLLAIACFSRSSKRFEQWLYHTKLYQIYVDENKLNPNPDPFIHLFTPEKMDGYANNETINREFYKRQEDEIYKIMKGKLRADCWVNNIILKKHSVSRTPIYLGMVMAGFWMLLFFKIILCK